MGINPTLYGVGRADDKVYQGVFEASMAGGVNLMFYGLGMSTSPAHFTVIFKDATTGQQTEGPPLTCKFH